MNIKLPVLLSCLGLLASSSYVHAQPSSQVLISQITSSPASFRMAGRINQRADSVNSTRVARSNSGRSANGLRVLALQLVNRDRHKQGLPPLTPNALLTQVAQKHAEDMVRKNYFSHTSLDGKSPTQRVRSAGGNITAGENIINYRSGSHLPKNTKLVAQFQHEFMNSPGHRKNILKSDYSHFGFGIAAEPGNRRIVVVQLFGIPPRY